MKNILTAVAALAIALFIQITSAQACFLGLVAGPLCLGLGWDNQPYGYYAQRRVYSTAPSGYYQPNYYPTDRIVPKAGLAHFNGPGRCVMSYPYEGEVGYVWDDGQCHHLPDP